MSHYIYYYILYRRSGVLNGATPYIYLYTIDNLFKVQKRTEDTEKSLKALVRAIFKYIGGYYNITENYLGILY